MSGLFNLYSYGDPMRQAARRYAGLVAGFRRRFPDRAVGECLSGVTLTILRKMLPEGTFERDRLEAIVSQVKRSDDPIEFCCQLVTFHTGIELQDGRAFLEQAEQVQEELRRRGVRDRSEWLLKLRSSLYNEPRSRPVASFDILRIPRFPNVGNWVGISLFGSIARGVRDFPSSYGRDHSTLHWRGVATDTSGILGIR